MFHDEFHPDIPLPDWNEFCDLHSPAFTSDFSPIEMVLDRNAFRMPDWYLPLARGAVIPSPSFLYRAGYRAGSRRAHGWYKPHCDVLWKDIGADSLIVRGFCGQPLWAIARNGSPNRPHGQKNMTLVHIFGSTPIFTRTYQAATYLAEFCYFNGPPEELRWVAECPDDISGAIDFALNRRIDEAVGSLATQAR
jgi:hypothetical protein